MDWTEDTMYLAWFDADRKKPVAEKIEEARERYVEKFGAEPVVCLVNPADVVEGSAVELRPATYIGRNCFWIGVDERAEEPAPPPPASEPATPAAARSARGRARAHPSDPGAVPSTAPATARPAKWPKPATVEPAQPSPAAVATRPAKGRKQTTVPASQPAPTA